MHTFKERLIAGLRARGWKEAECRSGKYAAFYHPDKETTLFVGNAGALRSGKCPSQSYSVGDPTRMTGLYLMFLNAGDAALPSENKAKIDLSRV